MSVDIDHIRFTPAQPPAMRIDAPFSVRAIARPATEFTGDFFYTSHVDGVFWFALGDFAGHGLEATIFMSMMQEMLEEQINACRYADPAEVVATLDRELRAHFPYNRFATLVLGRSFPDGTTHVVNAGHCPPFIARRDGSIDLVNSHGPVVGMLPAAAWRQQELHLEAGERLILYSDGLIEARNDSDEEFGVTRFLATIAEACRNTPLEEFFERAEEFSGRRLEDDATILVLERSPEP